MALRTILHHPDIRLRTKAVDVELFDDALKQIANDMIETMYHEEGIGLAGTQIDVHQRIVVIDISEERDQPCIYINPQITVLDGAVIEPFKEGCLSVPDYTEVVNRPNKVRIDYKDIEGTSHSEEAEGLLAICIQHECDHLEGKLFIDYLSQLKRTRISDKLRKFAKKQLA